MSLDRPAGDRVLSSHDRAARLRAAVPDVTRPVAVPALAARAEVWRDREGVPHVRAASLRDAFVAQGFVHAQDRLWHMEYDRRRAAAAGQSTWAPPGCRTMP